MTIKEFILDNIPVKVISTDEHDLTDKNLKKERNNICQACEFINNGLCKKCGCIVESKIIYKESRCPLEKW